MNNSLIALLITVFIVLALVGSITLQAYYHSRPAEVRRRWLIIFLSLLAYFALSLFLYHRPQWKLLVSARTWSYGMTYSVAGGIALMVILAWSGIGE